MNDDVSVGGESDLATHPSSSEKLPGQSSRFRTAPIIGVQVVASVTLMVMMLHIAANALLRTYADAPISGTLEYTQYWYLPMIAFLGLVLAQHDDQHIEARLIFERFTPHTQRWLQVCIDLLSAGLCVLFAYHGFHKAVENQSIGKTGGVLGITVWPVTYIVPICFGILTLQLVTRAVALATGKATLADPDHVGSEK